MSANTVHASTDRTATLDCTNYGKCIGVRSDAGPVLNVTFNGVMLYMGAATQYAAVMSELLGMVATLFTSSEGPSVAAHMSRIVKYRWVLRLSEAT